MQPAAKFVGATWQKIRSPHWCRRACFSFHPRKILTTGEGGMITTATTSLPRACADFGCTASISMRHSSPIGRVIERYAEPGFNSRMTDMQAAIGHVRLTDLARTIARRRGSPAPCRAAVIPGIGVPSEPAWARSNWQSLRVRLRRCGQFGVMNYLAAEGIASRRGYCARIASRHIRPGAGLARPMQAVAIVRVVAAPGLDESEKAQDRSILIPLFGAMTEGELDHVTYALAEACRRCRSDV